MKHSKGGPRAVFGQDGLEDYEMTFPRIIRRPARTPIAFEYKLLAFALIVTPIVVYLEHNGIIDRMLGI